MFRILRCPPAILSFFQAHKNSFHWAHFDYFRDLVVVMALAWGRRNVSNLYRQMDSRGLRPRERFNNFFLNGHWNPPEELQRKAYELLKKLGLRKRDVIELIIDDSKKKKRGKAMDAVSKIYDPTNKTFILGHQYVTAVLRVRGYTIPWGISLYVKVEDCESIDVEFRKTTELAAQLIRAFVAPKGVKVRVLFDSFYLCQRVVKACRQKKFRFLSTLASNRNLFKNGRKLKAGRYIRNLFSRRTKQRCSLPRGDRQTDFTYVDADWVQVSGMGKLHLVLSRKGNEPGILGIVTDDPSLSASEIIKVYGDRWHIEVFFKDAKQLLGLGQYQNGTYHAAVTHLHLVCFAHALLTHIAIERDRAQGKRKKHQAAWTTGRLQDELRRIAWEDLADHLKTLDSGEQVIKELERLLLAG